MNLVTPLKTNQVRYGIGWFTKNGMFVNPDKFKVFVIDKKEQTKQMKRYKLI